MKTERLKLQNFGIDWGNLNVQKKNSCLSEQETEETKKKRNR